MLCLTFLADLCLATFPHWWRFVVCSVLCLESRGVYSGYLPSAWVPSSLGLQRTDPTFQCFVLPVENRIASLLLRWEKLDCQAQSPH